MAVCSHRLRRVLTFSSSLIKLQRPIASIHTISSPYSPSSLSSSNCRNPDIDLPQPHSQIQLPFQSRLFRSSAATLAPPRTFNNNNNEEIGPDTILFEGCDYNHWLITMDFPKDPKPTPEEMVETYVQTLAKVVGSVEEAKKSMYACSTTTYHGFQAVMTEEMSEKFRGLPGVVFILPDSYIDPVNKEYGGDKYINGTIIPRPPPVQYGRQGGRYGDRNREYNRDRPSPRGPPPYRGNSAHDNQVPMQGDARNNNGQYNTPLQNLVTTGTVERRDPMPMSNAPGASYNNQMDGRDPRGPRQANYNQGDWRSEHPQGQRDIPPQDGRAFPAPRPRDTQGDNRNYAPPHGGGYGQGVGGAYGQEAGNAHGQGAGAGYGQGAGGYGQGAGGGYGQGAAGGYVQGAPGGYVQGAAGGYGQGAAGGYGQGAAGGYGQGAAGGYGQGAAGGYGQGATGGYGQSQQGYVGEQRFSEMEQRNNGHGASDNAATGTTGTDQGTY